MCEGDHSPFHHDCYAQNWRFDTIPYQHLSSRIEICNFHSSNHLMVSNYHLHPSLLQQPLGEELVVEGLGVQVEGDEVFFQQALDGALHCACGHF